VFCLTVKATVVLYLCVSLHKLHKMKIFQLIGQIVVIYFLYKLIFDFIVPFYKASQQVKSKMNEFKAQQQQPNQQSNSKTNPAGEKEYIDYEEVK
jgi:hypothetical protein